MKRLILICLCCIGLASCAKPYSEEENIFRNTQWTCVEYDGQTIYDGFADNESIIFDFDLYCDGYLTLYADGYLSSSTDMWDKYGEYLLSQRYKLLKVDDVTWYIPNFTYNTNPCCIYIIAKNSEYADVHILGENNYEIDNFAIRRNSKIVDLNKFIVD